VVRRLRPLCPDKPADTIAAMARSTRAQIVGWIAIFAVLLSTFLPAVSPSRGAAASIPWADICASGGANPVSTTAAPAGDPPAKSHGGTIGHCPYCFSNPASHSAPPPNQVQPVALVESRRAIVPTLEAARAHAAWHKPQSRAPPLAA